jgi:drug/metabolite transporter (DMT)-like permease
MTTDDITGRARRRLQAATAPLAPLLIIASALHYAARPDTLSEDKTVNLRLLETVAAHRDRTAIAGVLIMFALMSFLPFIAGLAAAVRERGAWLATLGAAMVIAGCFVAGVVNAFWVFNVKQRGAHTRIVAPPAVRRHS